MIRIQNDSDSTITTIMMMSEWTKESLSRNHHIEKKILHLDSTSLLFDFSECTCIDSAGAVEIIRLKEAIHTRGCSVDFVNLSSDIHKLLTFYEKNFSYKPTADSF